MTDTKQIIKQFLQGYKITIKNVVGNPFENALERTKTASGCEIVPEGDKRHEPLD
jgi:hypothetical protein